MGGIPLPQKVSEVLESFRADARAPEAGEILEAFARRYAPGVSYGEAFIETLFDLVGDEPLLVARSPSGAAAPAGRGVLPARRGQGEGGPRGASRRDRAPRERRQVRPRRVPAGRVSLLLGRRGREAPRRGPRRGGRRRREGLGLALDGRPDPPGLQVVPDAGRGQRARRRRRSPTTRRRSRSFRSSTSLLPFSCRARISSSSARRSAGPRKRSGSRRRNSCSRCPPRRAAIPEVEALSRIAADIRGEAGLSRARPATTIDPTLAGALETAGRKIAYQVEQLDRTDPEGGREKGRDRGEEEAAARDDAPAGGDSRREAVSPARADARLRTGRAGGDSRGRRGLDARARRSSTWAPTVRRRRRAFMPVKSPVEQCKNNQEKCTPD